MVALAGLVVGATALLGGNDMLHKPSSTVSPSSDWRPYSVVAPIDTYQRYYHHFRTEEVYPEWPLNGSADQDLRANP